MNNPKNIQQYWCPTHPEVVSTDPNAICTQCGTMKLIPKDPDLETSRGLVPKKKLKDFLPLILIFLTIATFTILMTIFVRTEPEFAMRMFMGSFFAIFGAFKVYNLHAFADAYQTYDIVAKRSRVYAYVYPFLELALAFLYLASVGGIARDIGALVLMAVSTIGVVQKIIQKEEVPCACLGMVFVLPMTWVTLIEDVLMVVMALVMIIL